MEIKHYFSVAFDKVLILTVLNGEDKQAFLLRLKAKRPQGGPDIVKGRGGSWNFPFDLESEPLPMVMGDSYLNDVVPWSEILKSQQSPEPKLIH